MTRDYIHLYHIISSRYRSYSIIVDTLYTTYSRVSHIMAHYHIDDIKTSTDTMVKPTSAIAVVDASQCIQAFDWYVCGGFVYVVLTAKGMMCDVRYNIYIRIYRISCRTYTTYHMLRMTVYRSPSYTDDHSIVYHGRPL